MGQHDMDDNQACMPMPRYVCHKEVWALKIATISTDIETDESTLWFDDARYSPKKVSPAWTTKHLPVPGGYLVVYDDGYESFSPKKAFEDGYTRKSP